MKKNICYSRKDESLHTVQIGMSVLRSAIFTVLISLIGACGTTKQSTVVLPTSTKMQVETPDPVTMGIAKKPRNIILMVGDGMGITQITAGLYENNNQLNLERCKVIGLHKPYAGNDLVTDSAAAATSFACGVKTYNGAIGVDMDTMPVKTILEYAEDNELATGLVATSTIIHATPASFVAHQPKRKMYEEIAADFLKTDVDFWVGGGKKYFDRRADKKNLLNTLKLKGYNVGTYLEGDLPTSVSQDKNYAYLTSDSDPLTKAAGRDYLVPATKLSMNFLENRGKGFFLMIEGSQIDWGGHANDSDYIISEMLEFDEAIGEVLDFAEKDGETLVIITADHETGGYPINKGSKMGEITTGTFTSDYHTADLIPVFAYGPGAEAFAGFYENTAIFDKMMEAFGWEVEVR